MPRLYLTDDFEAAIRLYRPDEGGRRSPVFNGVRWDFSYADAQENDTLHMIWPDFLTPDGDSRSGDEPLPVGLTLPARMVIVVEEMRSSVHRDRLTPGTRFYCHEGGRRVAEGTVTRLTGLSG